MRIDFRGDWHGAWRSLHEIVVWKLTTIRKTPLQQLNVVGGCTLLKGFAGLNFFSQPVNSKSFENI